MEGGGVCLLEMCAEVKNECDTLRNKCRASKIGERRSEFVMRRVFSSVTTVLHVLRGISLAIVAGNISRSLPLADVGVSVS